MQLSGQQVLVVGLGKSGVAAARLLLARGARVIGNDLRSETELPVEALSLRELGAKLVLGGHDPELLASVDRIVVSPGVPPLPALEHAARAGIPIWSEIELASRFIEGTLIGVTGTNGKSTVTSLVGAMCERSGRPTFVGGNLGTPLIEVVGTSAAQRGGYVAVELSSFQLERIEQLHVHAGALLNVSEDHLDRYPSLHAYAAAKARLFENQTPADTAVVPAGDAWCAQLARSGHGRLASFGGEDGEVRVEDDALVDQVSGLRVAVREIALTGRHNLDNACAAMLLARAAGVEGEAIAQALKAFQGLPHRARLLRVSRGVRYVNDSKGTNVGAAVAALKGLELDGAKVVLIAGGKDKGGDYAPLARAMTQVGRAALLIGEAAALIEQAFSAAGVETERAGSLQEAVRRASEIARPGDVVLLSPACASFDMFRSYAHRGEVFEAAVALLPDSEQEVAR